MVDYFYTRCVFQRNVRMKGFDVAYAMLRERMGKECRREWRCSIVFGNRPGAPYCRKCGVEAKQ